MMFLIFSKGRIKIITLLGLLSLECKCVTYRVKDLLSPFVKALYSSFLKPLNSNFMFGLRL